MFTFHKPKIYRSVQGCCICRAKSSSSRFTDSTRYENDFGKCFNIDEHRQGEICNACVLLVKRWKKLPKGSLRNWEHVVDARAGPGTKSMNKIKSKAAALGTKDPLKEERFKKKHKSKPVKKLQIVKQMQAAGALGFLKAPGSPSQFSDDIGDECMSVDSHSDDVDYSDSPSDIESQHSTSYMCKTTGRRRKTAPKTLRFSSFLDLTYWKKTEICCGIIFKGANGECLLDTSLWRPCRSCKTPAPSDATSTNTTTTTEAAKPVHNNPATPTSGITSPLAPPTSGGYAATFPPAPVEIEPLSHELDQAMFMPELAHTPMDDDDMQIDDRLADPFSSRQSALAARHQQRDLDNMTTLDNLILPLPLDTLSSTLNTPLQQQAPFSAVVLQN